MMIIQNSLVSDELAEVRFCCNLSLCKGLCCVEGDAGAPLGDEEPEEIEKHLQAIIPFMNPDSVALLRQSGWTAVDPEGKTVTALIGKRECIFVTFQKGIATCAIEMAYRSGLTDFPKPVSCHLYPARINDYDDFVSVNYHRWQICNSALACGQENALPLYRFLREPLIRRFGIEWYEELELVAAYLREKSNG